MKQNQSKTMKNDMKIMNFYVCMHGQNNHHQSNSGYWFLNVENFRNFQLAIEKKVKKTICLSKRFEEFGFKSNE